MAVIYISFLNSIQHIFRLHSLPLEKQTQVSPHSEHNLQPFSKDYDLVSTTTHVVCISFYTEVAGSTLVQVVRDAMMAYLTVF